MKIMSLGLDYKRYTKFGLLVPNLMRFMNKEKGFQYFPTKSIQKRIKEDCQFCFDFVVDSVIRIQDFDFDIEKH